MNKDTFFIVNKIWRLHLQKKKTRLFTQKIFFVLWANEFFTTNLFSYVKYFDRDNLKIDLLNYLVM